MCFAELRSRIDLKYNPAEAAKLWAQQHSLSKPFDDSMLFLNSVGKEYPICLSCDADDDMIEPRKQMYAFDYIFTSEQLGSCKVDANGRFFSAIIDHYGVKPEEIIHIGDSSFEIVGAGKARLITCWLNGTSGEWSHEIRPDFEVYSLIDAAAILGVNISSH